MDWIGETLLAAIRDDEAEHWGLTPSIVPGLWWIAELLYGMAWVIHETCNWSEAATAFKNHRRGAVAL